MVLITGTLVKTVLVIAFTSVELISAESHANVMRLVEKLDSGAEKLTVSDLRNAVDEYARWELDDFVEIQDTSEELSDKIELLQMFVFERARVIFSLEAGKQEEELDSVKSVWKELVPYYTGKSIGRSAPAPQTVGTDSITELLEELLADRDESLDRVKLLEAAQEYQQLVRRLRGLMGSARADNLDEIRSILNFKNQPGVHVLADIFFPVADYSVDSGMLKSLKEIFKMELFSHEF